MGVYGLALSLLIVCAAGGVSASEAPFLKSLAGNWTGGGTMKRTTASSPIKLSCNFQSKANGEALSMDGKCTGMLVVSRAVTAQLTAAGGNYTGRYIGPSGRVSSLRGARRGESIELAVTWSRIVNGDRAATMTIQRSGANELRIRTVDKDPSSGKQVVTSEINLQRN